MVAKWQPGAALVGHDGEDSVHAEAAIQV